MSCPAGSKGPGNALYSFPFGSAFEELPLQVLGSGEVRRLCACWQPQILTNSGSVCKLNCDIAPSSAM